MISQLKILGLWWSISTSESVDTNGNLGEMRSTKLQIALSPSMAVAQQGEVLLHEIFEAIVCQLGIKLEHSKLQALSASLHQVMVDNAEAFSAIGANEMPIVQLPLLTSIPTSLP